MCHSEDLKSDEESCRVSEFKARFLAEFTLSPFASLRAVRKRRANGLGMTPREGGGVTRMEGDRNTTWRDI